MKRYVPTLLTSLVLGGLAAFLWAGDLDKDKNRGQRMLEQVSKTVQEKFYDSELRGLDWQRLTKVTESRIDSAQSLGEIFAAIYWQLDQLQDSHTKFIPPTRVVKFLFGFEMKAFGENVMVHELDEKGAAAAAGLRLGDEILTVNGYAVERATLDLMLIYFRLLTPPTALTLEFRRGDEAPRTITIQGKKKEGLKVTDLTDVDTIYSLIRESESNAERFWYNRHEDGVGYLQLPSMTADSRLFAKLVDKVRDSKAWIIDLRGNRGGAVESLEDFLGYFEEKPVEVAQQLHRKKVEPIKAKPHRNPLLGPLAILVDSETASAAEVLARHFQRNGRAVVVGDHTAGQVSVSQVFSHKFGTEVIIPFAAQVAIARLQFADGEVLEGQGVRPDVPCVPTGAYLSSKTDICLAVAHGELRKKMDPSFGR